MIDRSRSELTHVERRAAFVFYCWQQLIVCLEATARLGFYVWKRAIACFVATLVAWQLFTGSPMRLEHILRSIL